MNRAGLAVKKEYLNFKICRIEYKMMNGIGRRLNTLEADGILNSDEIIALRDREKCTLILLQFSHERSTIL